MTHTTLDDDEKRKLDQNIDEFTRDPDRAQAEAQRIKSEFARKYGRAASSLLGSRFRVVRDLAINAVSLYEMLVDPDYTVPWETKASIIFALGYFVSPIDVIPDVIPVVGYLDDALVVGYVAHRLTGEIAKYRQWRVDQGRPLPAA